MNGNRVFVLACGGLGLMALSQLLIAGMALAVRFEEGQKVRIVEREVEKFVPIRVSVPLAGAESGAERTRPAATPRLELPAAPAPLPLEVPVIADPRSERLVTEGRRARVAGDMGMAIVKLEEALKESPGDPNVLFEMGEVHEAMGVYDKAARYYEQVFQMGVSGAGELYQTAAEKLSDGFEQPNEMLGKLALGRVRIFNDAKAEGGQRVILTVPVLKAPGQEVDSSGIEVEVAFFNKTTKGEIVMLEDKTWAAPVWASLPFDWEGGEEILRMDYQIPERDAQTAHLFGALSYYGQVATLTYKGEVLDVQAWPRELAARIGQSSSGGNHPYGDFPEFLDQDILPPNFDPDIPLLNPLPSD